MNTTKLLLLAAPLLLGACHDDEDAWVHPSRFDNYVVFGSFSGECIGNCQRLYLITEDKLYQDNDQPSRLAETALFVEKQVSANQLQLATQLLSPPNDLLENQYQESDFEQAIADFDYYLAGKVGDRSFTIVYDFVSEDATEEIRNYLALVEEVTQRINE